MKGLIACEESQVVCKAFRKKGFETYSADLLPCSGGHPEWHIQGDVLDILHNGWDFIIAHPPCTRLANSGVRWLHERNLWGDLYEATVFFNKMFVEDVSFIAVENPIPHKYAASQIGKYDQLVQPWQFGHGETKATCFWLKGFPPLTPTSVVDGRASRIHKLPPTADRARLRSVTYEGIAEAMAEQWGTFLIESYETRNRSV